MKYYPPDTEVTVIYNILPGQEGSFEDPSFPPEVEFNDIEIDGKPVSLKLYECLTERYGEEWEQEILRK